MSVWRSCGRKSGKKPVTDMTVMTPAIEMKDVLVRFQGKTVLNRFSMQLFPGEKVVLTGDSGLGKSTVLRCILGFVVPDEGRICIQGQELSTGTVWTLRRLLAYVPQEPELGNGTLEEWFKAPFSYRANLGLRKNLDRLPELLQSFALPRDLLRKEVSTLSGGEKQRAALIAAFLLDRKMFLLDEPTSALDRNNTNNVLEFLSKVPDASILAVSHERTFLEIADRIIELCPAGEDHAR